MRTLIATLTALMLFATTPVAGAWASTVLLYQGIDQFCPMFTQRAQRTLLVLSDKTGIARDVGGNNGSQSTVLTLQ